MADEQKINTGTPPPKAGDAEIQDENKPTPAEQAVGDLISNAREVIYSDLKGFRRYQILRAPKEVIDDWKRSVDQILETLKSRDFDTLRTLMLRNEHFLKKNFAAAHSILTQNNPDDEDLVLLAIGIFIARERSPWSMNRTRLKVLKGGTYTMESALEPDGWANCYDIAVIVRELSNLYGVQGKINGDRWKHAYFETENGKISDLMFYHRNGFFQNKEQFDAAMEERFIHHNSPFKKAKRWVIKKLGSKLFPDKEGKD